MTAYIRNLTKEQYDAVKRLAEVEIAKDGRRDIVGWPVGAHLQYNGIKEPCDMWTGPCACGAWHNEGI